MKSLLPLLLVPKPEMSSLPSRCTATPWASSLAPLISIRVWPSSLKLVSREPSALRRNTVRSLLLLVRVVL